MTLSGTLTASGTLSGGMSRSGGVSGVVSGGQPRILVDGVLKGDGTGNISAARSGFDYAAPIKDEAEGAVAHFTDGAAGPVDDLTIDINPVQDLHGYANPWPAGGGANILPKATAADMELYGITAVVSDNGSITINGTTTAVSFIRVALPSPLPVGDYAFSWFNPVSGGSNIQFSLRKSDIVTSAGGWNTASSVNRTFAFTSAYDAYYWQIQISSGASFSNFVFSPILVKGNTPASTYAPYSNICPISGWTGANVHVYKKNLLPALTVDDFAAGTVYGLSTYIAISVPNGNITVSTDAPTGYIWAGTKIGSNFTRVYSGMNQTFFATAGIVYIGIATDNKAAALAYNIQVEVGSTATAYEPYAGTTYPISWNTEAGTVYGGTLDVTTGVLTVDRAMLLYVGSQGENFILQSINSYGIANFNLNNRSNLPNYKNGTNNFINNRFGYQTTLISNTQTEGMYINNTGQEFLRIKSSVASTVDELKTWLASNNLQVCYELATPITYQLTPTQVTSLLGENNIWADTGNSKVKFYADTKLYIQQLTQPTEDDMTANANIASGKYFMVGNNLYYSTASIANGAKIIVGTNCNRVSLADALNNINS